MKKAKTNAEQFFKELAEKEADLQNSLENLKPTDLTDSDKKEIVIRVETMIDKMEKLKDKLHGDLPHKKAS